MKRLDRAIGWARTRDGALTIALTLAMFVASLALYVRTMAPGLMDGDEGEFQINIYRLGVSHTGYPIFFLLGKLWTLIVQTGTVATRANLFSAFWGALTVAAVFVFVYFLTNNRWAATITALLLAASRVEWSQAIIPRPYTLNSLFVVLVVFFFFLWRIGKVDLTVPVFWVGLSLTNHRTMMWFAPALALIVLAADYQDVIGQSMPGRNLWAILWQWMTHSPLLKPRRFLSLIAAFVLPLLLYGYVFWRGESDVGVEFHWKDFNDEIMGGYVRASWRFGPLDWLISRVTDLYIPMLIEQFTALGFIAGLVGMTALALDRVPRGWPRGLPAREALVFILLANLVSTVFCIIFWVIDIDKFFLQSFITFLFFTGVGIAIVWDWLSTRPARLLIRSLIVLAFAGAAGFLLSANYTGNDYSNRTDVITAWEENLAQPLEHGALIVGPWESLTPLEYAMYVDGRRTDLDRWKVIVKNYQLGQVPYDSRQADIEQAVHSGRAVYLTIDPRETETLAALADEFRLTRVGNLWRVLNLPEQASHPADKTIVTIKDHEGHAIELASASIYPTFTLHPGDFGLLTLWWRVPQPVSAHWTVSLRLVDAQGRVVYQRDAEPANGLRPTIGWAPGELVQDDAGFFIPADAEPGSFNLQVVVYDPTTGEELTSESGSSSWNVALVSILSR